MRHIILVAIALAVGNVSALCLSDAFEYNRKCEETSYKYPTFSNGERFVIGKEACFSIWNEKKPYKDTTIQGIPVTMITTFTPCKQIVDVRYNKRKNSYYGVYDTAPMYIEEYITTYAAYTSYQPQLHKGVSYSVRITSDVFYEDGSIEIYREDGSLRYKGRVILSDSSVSTSGDCYDKKGKITRHTNNADFCQ